MRKAVCTINPEQIDDEQKILLEIALRTNYVKHLSSLGVSAVCPWLHRPVDPVIWLLCNHANLSM
ncbi:MAG: hypothetical protein CUN55_17555 [Phototrophicales bacterium]|nr:MAG: hypothetical protein CUN55_17555 [Phototrophicales bacterium]